MEATIQAETMSILQELRREFEAVFGANLVNMVLFGSQARGDAGPDSDFDVLVVLKDPDGSAEARRRAGDVRAQVLFGSGADVQLRHVSESDFAIGKTALLRNVWREGIALENLERVTDPTASAEERIGSVPSLDLDNVDRWPAQLQRLRQGQGEVTGARMWAGPGSSALRETHGALLHLGRVFLLREACDELRCSAIAEGLRRVASVGGRVPDGLRCCVQEANELQQEADWRPAEPRADKVAELLARAEEFLGLAESLIGPIPRASEESE